MVYVHVIINSVLNTSGKGYRRFLKMHLLSFICMVFLWFLFMRCSFGTLLICCSAPFVSRFFIFSFLFISLLLLLWITNMLLLWYLIYIFLLFYCCHFMLHLCFSFYLYASNFCRGPHLLCSWFMYFFLWNFVLEHCSLSPHFITMKTFKNFLNVFFLILYKPKWVTFENKTYIQMVSYLYNIQIIMKIDIWCYSKHTKK